MGVHASSDGVTAAFTSRKLSQVPPDFGDGSSCARRGCPRSFRWHSDRRHVGFRGLADIEFKLHPKTGEYCLLDIQPAPRLWINLPTACGVNLAYAAYRDAVGLPLDPNAFVQRDFETRWVSARGLAVALVRSIMSGRPLEHLRTLVGQLRGRRVGPLYARSDVLFRMFLNPAYWWASFRQSIQGVSRLHGASSHGRPAWEASVVTPASSKVAESPRCKASSTIARSSRRACASGSARQGEDRAERRPGCDTHSTRLSALVEIEATRASIGAVCRALPPADA